LYGNAISRIRRPERPTHGSVCILGVSKDSLIKRKAAPIFNPKVFLAKVGNGRTLAEYKKSQRIFFARGSADFFGEGCLAGQPLRMASAAAMSECSIMRLEKQGVIRMLRSERAFSELFLHYLLSRNIRIEEDLVDQLFNSSERRLARVLLLMANFGKEAKAEPVIPKISQETLAEIVGTTRSRVSFFMNRFRKLGFIEYNCGLEVHGSLLNVVLHD
jgi:CRP/FNR family transcriptional regulator, cyclic AMP receptor protein